MDLRLAQLRTLARGGAARQLLAGRRGAAPEPTRPSACRCVSSRRGSALSCSSASASASSHAAGETCSRHGERIFAEIEAARRRCRSRSDAVAGPVRLGTGADRQHLPSAGAPAAPAAAAPGPRTERDHRQHARHRAGGRRQRARRRGRHPADRRARADRNAVLSRQAGGDRAAEKRWRGLRTIAPTALAREPLILFERGGAIRAVMDGWFAKAKSVANVTMELGNAEASKKLVGAGLGLSIISAIAVKKEVAAGELVALAPDPAPGPHAGHGASPRQAVDASAGRRAAEHWMSSHARTALGLLASPGAAVSHYPRTLNDGWYAAASPGCCRPDRRRRDRRDSRSPP